MTIHYQGHGVTMHHGDCLDVLRALPDASVDSVVTDPPYNLSFMGKGWDTFPIRKRGQGGTGIHSEHAGGVEFKMTAATSHAFQQWCELWAAECLRVLKPGGHLLAFGGTRTWHRLACAVEDAGFEVRDSIAWMYGSGFPKSLDVSKAIDKAEQSRHQQDAIAARARGDHAAERRALDAMALAEREVVGIGKSGRASRPADETQSRGVAYRFADDAPITAPATPAAEQWQGWGTALKPAFEPVVVARKPLSGTVAATVLEHGTGALNIDACRIGDGGGTTKGNPPKGESNGIYGNGINGACDIVDLGKGRWPANVVLDESQAEALDEQSGTQRDGVAVKRNGRTEAAEGWGNIGKAAVGTPDETYGGQGGASRFFYVAKADATERPRVNGTAHPTVKPLSLMRWLVRLVTPPGGTVLEPFAGSGTTVEACIVEGFDCIAIEKGDEYLPLIMQRIHRRRDPVAAIRQTGDELGLFELDGEGA